MECCVSRRIRQSSFPPLPIQLNPLTPNSSYLFTMIHSSTINLHIRSPDMFLLSSDGYRFAIRSSILASQSPILSGALQCIRRRTHAGGSVQLSMKEDSQTLEIMLRYLFKDDCMPPRARDLRYDTLFPAYRAAAFYGMKGLLNTLSDKLV